MCYFFETQDWDANGTIDFAEFVHTFSDWVDIEEDEADIETSPRQSPAPV